MDSILLIFICLLSGVFIRRFPQFPANTHMVLNQFVIWISLPALALAYIPSIRIAPDLVFPLAVGWLTFLLSWLVFALLGKWLGWSRKLTGCLILMGGLGNTSFVGFPVIEALYGSKGLETAIVLDQPGTFLVLATLGIIVAVAYSGKAGEKADILGRVFRFPPFLAFVLALALNLLRFDFPDALHGTFLKLGATVTPLALVAVGLQLKIPRRSRHWGFVGLGLIFKLVLIPMVFFVLYRIVLGRSGMETDVCILEAAMAPMVTAGVLCHQFGLKPRLASTLLGVGIPLSFATLALWYFLLG